MKNINEFLNDEGNFRTYTMIGCYPLYYYCNDGDVLCSDCANEWKEDVIDCGVNWEDPTLTCDNCSKNIEAAYCD